MKNRYKEKANIFKAFSDDNRIRILEMLKDGEKCACKILDELEISQSTLSHHMKILVKSGVVCARVEGKWTHYSISKSGVKNVCDLLMDITSYKEDESK